MRTPKIRAHHGSIMGPARGPCLSWHLGSKQRGRGKIYHEEKRSVVEQYEEIEERMKEEQRVKRRGPQEERVEVATPRSAPPDPYRVKHLR